jgi:hypothetical protein
MTLPRPGAPPLHPIAGNHHWPSTLVLPARPPKLIYLDMNHWVALSKAFAGHADGAAHRPALDACIAAADRRGFVFPLADAIYYEISRIGAHRQRRHLTEVMERVSRYFVITSRSIIADHEVESVLDRLVGPSPEPINRMAYLDWGVARAFGMMGGFRFLDKATGEDVTDHVRATHPLGPERLDAALRDAELKLNRKSLEGPSSRAEEDDLKRNGWDPHVAHRSAVQRAQQETDQAARLAAEPEWRRGRIRDVIAAHEMVVELMDKLTRGLTARRADSAAVFTNDAVSRQAFAEMPSFDVAVTLKASYHRDGTRTWKPNDVNDIDAMGSTIPYCDIVVTDKAVVNHVRRTHLPERFGTTVLSRLDDLIPLL